MKSPVEEAPAGPDEDPSHPSPHLPGEPLSSATGAAAALRHPLIVLPDRDAELPADATTVSPLTNIPLEFPQPPAYSQPPGYSSASEPAQSVGSAQPLDPSQPSKHSQSPEFSQLFTELAAEVPPIPVASPVGPQPSIEPSAEPHSPTDPHSAREPPAGSQSSVDFQSLGELSTQLRPPPSDHAATAPPAVQDGRFSPERAASLERQRPVGSAPSTPQGYGPPKNPQYQPAAPAAPQLLTHSSNSLLPAQVSYGDPRYPPFSGGAGVPPAVLPLPLDASQYGPPRDPLYPPTISPGHSGPPSDLQGSQSGYGPARDPLYPSAIAPAHSSGASPNRPALESTHQTYGSARDPLYPPVGPGHSGSLPGYGPPKDAYQPGDAQRPGASRQPAPPSTLTKDQEALLELLTKAGAEKLVADLRRKGSAQECECGEVAPPGTVVGLTGLAALLIYMLSIKTIGSAGASGRALKREWAGGSNLCIEWAR